MARIKNAKAPESKYRPSSLCTGGAGYGRKQGLDAHPMRYQSKYDDPTRGLAGIALGFEESKAAYTCRRCGEHQGCRVCIDDLASLVCSHCRDWANDISERVHGRMVKNPQLKVEGMRLVQLRYEGKINQEEFDKAWKDACAVFQPKLIEYSQKEDGDV